MCVCVFFLNISGFNYSSHTRTNVGLVLNLENIFGYDTLFENSIC